MLITIREQVDTTVSRLESILATWALHDLDFLSINPIDPQGFTIKCRSVSKTCLRRKVNMLDLPSAVRWLNTFKNLAQKLKKDKCRQVFTHYLFQLNKYN